MNKNDFNQSVNQQVYDSQYESKQPDMSMYDNFYNPRVLYSRKLYSMLLLQMILIGIQQIFEFYEGIATYIVHINQSIQKSLSKMQHLIYIALAGVIGVSLFALIFRNLARSQPLNYIIYFMFTSSAALLSVVLISMGDSIVGLLVFFSLASIILLLFVYSLTVKKRLTYQGATLFLTGSVMIVFEIFTVFSNVSLLNLIIVSLGSFLFAYFLIYDTQTSVSSGDRYDVSQEDSVSGSVVIYWDIVLLMLHMTEMLRDFLVKERN